MLAFTVEAYDRKVAVDIACLRTVWKTNLGPPVIPSSTLGPLSNAKPNSRTKNQIIRSLTPNLTQADNGLYHFHLPAHFPRFTRLIDHLLHSVALLSSLTSDCPLFSLPFNLGLLLHLLDPDLCRRARVSLNFALVVSGTGFCYAAVFCLLTEVFVIGLLYAVLFVLKLRWVLEFPIIKCPPVCSFKIALPSACAYVLSTIMLLFLLDWSGGLVSVSRFLGEQVELFVHY
ncbi:unnamed protein product [Eruca vesicaria subsp. sativa]|uniref:Uncharacterized protein n=1 Tax=Eruca vesicaria subsp. sativa TaxID=29727 RepID=A0ABC8IX65_ERUVS|nr:unnamed protein product [Eruca vesicaria subsp. sativa]